MISEKCYTQEWVEEKSVELGIRDKNLIEKVIMATSSSTSISESPTASSKAT